MRLPKRLLAADVAVVIAGVLIVSALSAFVYQTVSQIRQALAEEVLQQQQDIAGLLHQHALLLGRLQRWHDGADAAFDDVGASLDDTLRRLEGMRRDYSFASLDGAAGAHALAGPALADVRRWRARGIQTYPPRSPLVAAIALGRVADVHPRLLDISLQTDARASALIATERRRLGRFALALTTMLAAFGCATLAVMLLFIRQRNAKGKLLAVQDRARATLASIGDAVISCDASGRVDYLNPVAERLTGWRSAEARHRPLGHVFYSIDEESRKPLPDPVAECLQSGRGSDRDGAGSALLLNRQGREFAIDTTVTPIRGRAKNDDVLGAVLVFSDVSESRRLRREIMIQASHDSLTGLFNRREFEQRLSRAVGDGGEHALLYLDLDHFKIVNDSCGHAAGDELLRQLTALLRRHIRRDDVLGRLGGDEFGLLMEHCPEAQALRAADTLRQAVEDFRFGWKDQNFSVGVSVGLVPLGGRSVNGGRIEHPGAALRAADRACYAAKDGGRNRVEVYRAGDADTNHQHGEMRWASRIAGALQQQRFRLLAQPIRRLDAGSGEPGARYELLLRMIGDDGSDVLPGAFLPAAERYDMAVRVDRWVVAEALQRFADHRDWFAGVDFCSINLSAHSLDDDVFLQFVLDSLDRLGLNDDAGKLCFEITETAAIARLAAAERFIAALRARGCRFALDDFGSGLSSFAYLKTLPVDFIKIDGPLVRDIAADPVDLATVRSINEIAQLTGKQTIAEFAETAAVLQRLVELGVDYAQGYGVGGPRPLDDLLAPRPGARSSGALSSG